MLKSTKYLVILLILSSMYLITAINYPTYAKNEIKILYFIEDGFGDSYYINKGIMESYNWTIITASSEEFITGCKNNDKNITDTYSDFLVEDITDSDLSDYDCLLVPSGGHWSNVMSIKRNRELLQMAHEEGILVAGICTGMIVLAYADMLENVSVAYNVHATEWLRYAGANMTSYPVVSDQGIITGGWGGGIGGGPEGAPNEEFCEKIKEEIEIANQADFVFSFLVGTLLITAYISAIYRKKKK